MPPDLTLVEKAPPQVLLDVQGVAYEVDVPMSTFYNLPATGEKVAPTDLSASIVTSKGLVLPVASPLQPVKLKPAAATAVRLTTVPCP